jgi:hypothetical protein
MLTTLKLNDSDIYLNLEFGSENYSSDRDYYFKKIINDRIDLVTNKLVDGEIYSYKPKINELNFNIFFLRYIQDSDYEEIKDYLEEDFTSHFNLTKNSLFISNDNPFSSGKSFNNVYENRQDNGLRDSEAINDSNLTRRNVLINSPHYIRDLIGESFLKKPIRSGLPIFYNSFIFPFWNSKSFWIDNKNLYNDLDFFNRSFLFLEIFNSFDSNNQVRLSSIPVFMGKSKNIFEKNLKYGTDLLRPSLKLKDGDDGNSIFFINNYQSSSLYVRYSFWDALNRIKINLVPSGNNNKNRKWLQNAESFKSEFNYLKYELDFDTKTYRIYEFSDFDYDREVKSIDLYELFFDQYYANLFIENSKPKDSRVITDEVVVENPFSFSIQNIIEDIYLGNKSTGFLPLLNNNQINQAKTFINSTNKHLAIYNEYYTLDNKVVFGDLSNSLIKNEFTESEYNGFKLELKSFSFKNESNEIWKLRSLDFNNVIISVDDNKLINGINKISKSSWNSSNQGVLSETAFISDTSRVKYRLNYGTDIFTRDVIGKYLDRVEVFNILIEAISSERIQSINSSTNIFQNNFNNDFNDNSNGNFDDAFLFINQPGQQNNQQNSIQYNKTIVSDYLNILFSYLGILTNGETTVVDNYALGASNQLYINSSNFHTELFSYIGLIVDRFIKIKETDIESFNGIIDATLSFMDRYFNETLDRYNICKPVIDKVYTIMNPADYDDLLDGYLLLLTQKNLSYYDKDLIKNKLTKDKIPLYFGKSKTQVGFETRSYIFNLLANFNGFERINRNETRQIDIMLNIGEKIQHIMSNASKLKLSGKFKISLINENSRIINVNIPFNFNILPKK